MTNQKITEMKHLSDKIHDKVQEIKDKTKGGIPILKYIAALPLIIKTIEDIVMLIKRLLDELKEID
jgi:hypothetical protein